ncbi:hypothetical protein BCF46_3516 [Litoreibacter meonggei]|uniref:Uncharacterized protein n=1 Tax=Litoreibacter meonggei TaxID=1049199 RepID=A0A497VL49_9RHOB|nr:hypothetical protein [Litoreibacter meonggei]RLJ40945.1 hypothetical protein BCF46_3516 [Litoreibacter meonggei]
MAIEGDIPDFLSTGGDIAIPVDVGGQGGDAACSEAACVEVQVFQYPFERRMSETDIEYGFRLNQRFDEVTALAGFRNGSFLQDIDPAYAAELVALYYALLHDIGVPEDGFSIPSRTPEEYEAFCLTFGVGSTDYLMCPQASDSVQQMFADEPSQWINSNISDGQAHVWAAASFPGPDGTIYYRMAYGRTLWSNEMLPIDPVVAGWANGGYAAPSITFDDYGAGTLRDLFWKMFGSVGADINNFGPVPSHWFDQSSLSPVRNIDIFYGSPPAAVLFEPFQVADSSLNGVRQLLSGRVQNGAVGTNRIHRGVVFGSLRRGQTQMAAGRFTRVELDSALRTHGPPNGVNNIGDFSALAHRDPRAARNLATTVLRSAYMRSPEAQISRRASLQQGSDSITRRGGEVNGEGFDVRIGRSSVRVIPDGLT